LRNGNASGLTAPFFSSPKINLLTACPAICLQQSKLNSSRTVRENFACNTFGGDRSDYSGPTKADAGDIETFKLLANAVVSDPHSRMMTLDIKDFYLNELLEIPEYMMVKLSDIQLLSLSATACLPGRHPRYAACRC
jgi:hypothetical protein